MSNALLSFVFLALVPCLSKAQVNDQCSAVTPEALVVGTPLVFTGDNTGATLTNDYVPGTILANVGVPSVWHAFTTTECSDIVLAYCGTASAFSDYWNVFATTCPASNALIVTQLYNDTDCGDGNPTVYFNNVPAGTYYYPVWTQAGTAEGPYTITLSALACGGSNTPNDNCADVTAEVLSVGASLTLSGNNTNATANGDFAAGSPYAGAPVAWHKFTTSECSTVTLSYCGLTPSWNNTFGFFARDCPGSDLVFFSSFNTTACGDGNRTYVFNQLAAGTYFVPVLLDPGNNAVGAYSLQLSATACPGQPSFYDLCAQVQYEPLGIGASLNLIGDNTNATGTDDFAAGSPFTGAPVVWHGITTSACSNLTISFCGLDPVWDNTFGFLGTQCPLANPIYFTTFDNTTCVDGNRTYIFNSLPAGNYLIPVLLDALNNAVGPYTIVVSATSCPVGPPANDNCAQVNALPLAVGTTLQFAGDNSSATSAGDFVEGSPFIAAPVVWHAFITDECTDLLVEYCGQTPAWSNTFGFLATTCPGDALVFFTTTDLNACNDGNTTYEYNDLDPGTYYVPVLRDDPNNSAGQYSITVRAENCMFLGVSLVDATAVQISPNPSDGRFVIRGMSPGKTTIRVLDTTGRAVYVQWSTVIAGGTTELELGGRTAAGTYLVELTNAHQRSVHRIVVR